MIYVHVSPLSRSGIELKKWPHPVQTFTANDISASGPASIVRMLNEKAVGLTMVNSQANPYQPTILYHGCEISPIQGTPADLSVYVNGARFNTPFGDLAIWSALPDAAISSLSIEDGNPVFGLNALGGAVNVQMKNGFNDPGSEIEASGGSFGKVEGNIQYGKQSENIAAYVDIGAVHEGGWRDLQSSNIQNFYGDVGWRGERAKLDFNATLANSDLNGPGTVPVQILGVDPAAQFTGPNAITDKYVKLSTVLDDQLTAASSLQAVLYFDHLRDNLANGNGPNDLPCGPGPDAAYICEGGPGGSVSTGKGGVLIPNFLPVPNAYGYYSYSQLNLNSTNTNGYGGSAQVTNHNPVFGVASRLTAGLSYDGGFTSYDAAGYVGGINASRVYFTPPGIPSPGYELDEPGTVPVNVVIRNAYYGAYLSETLSLGRNLFVTGSGRFNIGNIALHDQNPPDPNAPVGGLPGGGLTGRHYYQHFNPAIGVAFDATNYLTLYGGYSEANAVPTPAELSCASPADSCSLANFMSGDPDLKQVVSRSLEAGLRGTVIGPDVFIIGYDLDVYHSVTSDDIEFLQSPYNPIGEGYFSNIGNVRRQGFDASITVDGANWHVYGNYAYTDATYLSPFIERSNNPEADANGNITIQPGDHLPGIPENIFKAGADYQATRQWNLGVAMVGQTGAYLYGDAANLTPQLPGYVVVNFSTSYQLTPNFQVFGEIDNVTDTKYYDYGTFSPTGKDGGVYVSQDPGYSNPRSYSIAAPVGGFVGIKASF